MITPEELADALAEQKTCGKRIGEILVGKGYVSGPALTTVLAEQLGVVMEKQKGFGSGLWTEIKRRHPREKHQELEDALEEQLATHESHLTLIDKLEQEAVDEEVAEIENMRQQLAFAVRGLDEERAAHDGTRRIVSEARSEADTLEREVEALHQRIAAGEGSVERLSRSEHELASAEEAVEALRAELACKDEQLAASGEASAALEAEAARLSAELGELRAERKDLEAAAAEIAESAERRHAENAEARRKVDEALADGASLQATVKELRADLGARDQELALASEARAALESELGAVRDDLAAREAARTREADARVAAEAAAGAELSRLRSNVDELSASLERERVAHGAARREASRLESRCAELKPLEALLAEANTDAAARAQQVNGLREELAAARVDIEALEAELAERPEGPPVEEHASEHLAFLPSVNSYSLAQRPGPAPEVGADEDADGLRLRVVRVGRSPLPADRRRCAYLEAV